MAVTNGFDYLCGLSDGQLKKAMSDPSTREQVMFLMEQLKQMVDVEKTRPTHWEHKFNWIISGPTQSGKTHFLSDVLAKRLIQPMPQSIHLFTGVKESEGRLLSVLRRLEKEDGIQLHQYGDDVNQVKAALTVPGRKLIIMDDLQYKVVRNPEVGNLFLNATHHSNASAILIWQDLYPQGSPGLAQSLANNAHYLSIFYTPRDTSWNHYLNSHKSQKAMLKSLYGQMDPRKRSTQPLNIASMKGYAWLTSDPDTVYDLRE